MCLLYCACHAKCIFADPLQTSHACHRFWNGRKTHTFGPLLTRCRIHCACHTKRNLNVQSGPKFTIYYVDLQTCFAPQPRALLSSSTSKSAPGMVCFVPFGLQVCFAPQRRIFNISTSKNAPRMVCFAPFELQMCFAPQLRALFRHLNFQAVRDRGVLSILTLKSASRHSVQFTILHLTILCRRTRRFSKPTFRASRATKHLKSTVFRDFPTLSRAFLFFLLTRSLLCSSFFFLSLLWLFPPLLLHLSFSSKDWLRNFLR